MTAQVKLQELSVVNMSDTALAIHVRCDIVVDADLLTPSATKS